MSKHPLYLIDAYGLIYRSYFAFLTRPLRNNSGKNVSALFGFARNIISLLDNGVPAADASGKLLDKPEKPLRLAAIFDSASPTFRHKMYPDYKANRQKTPDDLYEQIPLVKEFLDCLGIKRLKAEGFEADDIIAALAEKCRSEKRRCYILSSDKDLLQLVGDGIYELRPSRINRSSEAAMSGSLPTWDLTGTAEVKDEWGVEPSKMLDLLSLIGDTSDNIPGVKGIGEKTASKLIMRYGSLDGIYKNIAAIEGANGKKLSEGKESAYFSQSLIRLRSDAPLSVSDIDELSTENLNRSAGARVLMREGIRQSAKQLDPHAAPVMPAAPSRPPSGGADTTAAPAGSGLTASGLTACGLDVYFGTADQTLLGDGVYKAVASINELKSIIELAHKQKHLALDFETDSLDAWNSRPVGISLALKPKEAFYVPLAHTQAQNFSLQEVFSLLSPLFADSGMTIIAHNAKFDYKVSRGGGIERWQCKIWDTMVAAWLIDPERSSYSLDSLASYAFNCTPIRYVDIVPKGSAFDSVPLETAVRYSGEDADYCLRLKYHLEPVLNKTGLLFENLEMPLLPILAEMEGCGIKIEGTALTEFGKELSLELNQIQKETWKIVGHEFNLSSTKQLQEVLFVERKLVPKKKIKTGYSTDAAALEELAHEDPVPALILRHRILSKLKSTYVDTLAGMTDSEGRLHTNFIQTGTATGRLSSRDPNLQNIPIRTEEGRRIREAFTAKPGCLLVSADYSQIELVILAHLSGDENLTAAFRENKDVHARTASLIFGIDEDKISGEQRRMAKIINFGVIYGMSAFRLANELNISRTDANNFIEAYFKTYSGVRQFIENTIKKTEKDGYVTTILGRRRYIPMINSRNKTEKSAAERVAVNTPIQGSAADIVKTAMLNLDRRLLSDTEKKLSARLLLQVHDELILECPEKEAAGTISLVKTEMENAVKLSVPLRATVEAGKCWGDFH